MTDAAFHLALYNFGLHVAPFEDPAIDGFRLREPFNFEAAKRAEGFVGRSGYVGEPGPRSWGPQVFPRYLAGTGFDSGPSGRCRRDVPAARRLPPSRADAEPAPTTGRAAARPA